MSYRGGFGRSGGGDSWGEGQEDSCYVPIRDCGKIIGRGGSRIRELQEQSGCRIKVCQEDEGDGTRRVELNGTDDAIDKAKALIMQILEEGDDRGARMMPQQSYGGGSSKEIIQVQSNFVGRIIGKGGSRIRELQDDTGCRINVSRNGGNNGHTDVELIGSQSQIQDAKDAIYDLTNQLY